MLLGVMIGRKSYTSMKYFIVLMIVIGVGLFIYKGRVSNEKVDEFSSGIYLIGFSLLMDGMTGAMQDRMRASVKPTSMHIMLYINAWSAGILITVMAVTGEGRDFIDFALRHPAIVWQMTALVVVGTVGQVFISIMISNFGSLPLSIVTTTRKFFTVFVSVLIFGNSLTVQQWIATGIIFTALFLDACFGKKALSSVLVSVEDNNENVIDESEKLKNILAKAEVRIAV